MAMTVSELQVKVSADTSDAEKGLSSLGTSVGNAGKAFAGLATGAAVAGLAGLAAGLVASVTAAAGFEAQMSAIGAVSGATVDEMTMLADAALQLGADTSFSASEAAQGMEELIKAGVSVGDVLGGAAAASLNLAAAGAVEVKDAAEIAANAMNQFGLKGSDMAHVADMIAGAANASAIDVSDFKFSLAAVGAVANTVGATFDDTAVAIALMGQAGIKGSDAGTSLKTMLLNLQPTTEKQISLFRELGITTADGTNRFFDQEGKLRGLGEVAQVLTESLTGMTDAQKLATLETIFGSDAIRAAAVFAKQGGDGFANMAEQMGKVTAAAVAAERLNNLKGDIEQLTGSLETAGIKIGMAFLPGLRSITQGATELVNTTAPVMEQFAHRASDAITVASEQIADAWRTARQAFAGEWLPSGDIPPFVNAVGRAAIAVKEFGDFLGKVAEKARDNGALDSFANAAAIIADELDGARQRASDFSAAIENVHRALGGAEGEATATAAALKILGVAFEVVALTIGQSLDGMQTLGTVLVDLIAMVGSAGRALTSLATGDIAGMNDALAAGDVAFEHMVTTISGFADRGTARIVEAWATIKGETHQGTTETQAAVETGMAGAAAAIDDGSLAMQASMASGMTGVVGAVEGAVPSAVGAAQEMGSGMAAGIEAAAPAMEAAAASGASSAVAAVEGQTGAASGAGQSLGQALGSGLEGGILAYVGRVASAAARLVSAAIAAASGPQGADAHSPSKKTEKLGKDMAEGLEIGLNSSQLGEDMKAKIRDFIAATREYIPTAREIARVEQEIKDIREESQTDALFRAEKMITLDSETLRLKEAQVRLDRDSIGLRQDLAAATREIADAERGTLAERTATIEIDAQRKRIRLETLDLEKQLLTVHKTSDRTEFIKKQIEALRDQDRLLAIEAERITTTNSLATTAARVRREGLDDQVRGVDAVVLAIKNQIDVLGAERGVFEANEQIIANATRNEIAYRERLIAVFTAEGKPLADRITAGRALLEQLKNEGKISDELYNAIKKATEQIAGPAGATNATRGLGAATQAATPQIAAAASQVDRMGQEALAMAEAQRQAAMQTNALASALGRLPSWFRPTGSSAPSFSFSGSASSQPVGVPSAFAGGSAFGGGGAPQTIRVDVAVGGKVARQIVVEGYDLAVRQGWTPGGLTG